MFVWLALALSAGADAGSRDVAAAVVDAGAPVAPAMRIITVRVGKRTFGQVLDDLGLPGSEAHRLISATRRDKKREEGIDYTASAPRTW